MLTKRKQAVLRAVLRECGTNDPWQLTGADHAFYVLLIDLFSKKS